MSGVLLMLPKDNQEEFLNKAPNYMDLELRRKMKTRDKHPVVISSELMAQAKGKWVVSKGNQVMRCREGY